MPATALQRAGGRDEHSICADVLFVDPARGDYRVKDNSPVLTLGFKNFPMDQFGVTDPRLRALARTPFASAARPAPQTQAVVRDPAPRGFLGARVKNIIGQGEVSAYGLPGEVGVLLIQVPAGSVADKGGLKEGDVILRGHGQEISSLDDLFKVMGSTAKGTKVTLDLWRLQRPASAEVKVE
jgi:hypothetical protein